MTKQQSYNNTTIRYNAKGDVGEKALVRMRRCEGGRGGGSRSRKRNAIEKGGVGLSLYCAKMIIKTKAEGSSVSEKNQASWPGKGSI